MPGRKVYVVGVGMTKVCSYDVSMLVQTLRTRKYLLTYEIFCCLQFEKPGKREDFDYPDMAKEAGW